MIITKFKIFESNATLPKQKFPLDKCINLYHLVDFLKSNGFKPDPSYKKTLINFCQEKLIDTLFFPKKTLGEVIYEPGDPRGNMIYGESAFYLPKSYDASGDENEFNYRKKLIMDKMLVELGEEEFEKIKDKIESNVNMGNKSYDWVNPMLDAIYQKYSKYYVNDKLRVWSSDKGYIWEGYDYPFIYCPKGTLEAPNGRFYLSDIEKYIYNRYGIQDDLFYDYIVKNNYISGRHWETVLSLNANEDKTDFKRNNDKHGMEPTENINHMLNIINKDFPEHMKNDGFGRFHIYMDYFKGVDS